MNALAPAVAAAFGLTMALLCAIGGTRSESAVAAEGEGFGVLPGQAPRFSGPQGREADVTRTTRDGRANRLQ